MQGLLVQEIGVGGSECSLDRVGGCGELGEDSTPRPYMMKTFWMILQRIGVSRGSDTRLTSAREDDRVRSLVERVWQRNEKRSEKRHSSSTTLEGGLPMHLHETQLQADGKADQ